MKIYPILSQNNNANSSNKFITQLNDIWQSSFITNNNSKTKDSDNFTLTNPKSDRIIKIAVICVGIISVFLCFLKRKSIGKILSNLFNKNKPTNEIKEVPDNLTKDIPPKAPKTENIKKTIPEIVDRDEEFLKTANKNDRLDYFKTMRFFNNEEEAFKYLDNFEKYGLDLKLTDNVFKMNDNIKFFGTLPQNTSDRLISRYIEVFNKYTKINPNELTKKVIETSYFPWDIKIIQTAINELADITTKKDLQETLDNRITYLHQEKFRHNIQNFLKIVEKYLYPSKNISPERESEIIEKYGKEYGENYIKKLSYPLSVQEALHLSCIASIDNGKYFDFCKNNIETLKLLSNSGSLVGGEKVVGYLPTIINSVNKFLKDNNGKKQIDALITYSNCGYYDTINGILRFNNKIDKIINSLTIKDKINDLPKEMNVLEDITEKIFNLGNDIEEGMQNRKQFLNKLEQIKQTIATNNQDKDKILQQLIEFKTLIMNKYKDSKAQITTDTLTELLNAKINNYETPLLIRNEDASIFEQLEINNQKLSELMNDKTQTETVLNYLKNEKPKIKQSGFSSTSIAPFETLRGKKIKWILETDENTKGFYIEDIRKIFEYSNKENYTGAEAEFLIPPNATIKITDAEYKNNRYKIFGIITHENLPN